MQLLGIFFALGAGIFFGILAPTTKIAFNLGVGVSLAIILRYFVASLLISPLVPFQTNLISNYKKNLSDLSYKELKVLEPNIKEDVIKVFDLKYSVNSKKTYGGTSFENIKKMIKKYKNA